MQRLLFGLLVSFLTFSVGVMLALLWQPQIPTVVSDAVSLVPLLQSESPLEPAGLPAIEAEWEALTKASFCFAESNDYFLRPGGPSRFDFDPYTWFPSARQNRAAVISFLIEQIPDQTETGLHVCPFNTATKGEVAIYSLGHLLQRNWFDLTPKYRQRYDSLSSNVSSNVSSQRLLRRIIHRKKSGKQMMAAWRQYSMRQLSQPR